MYNEQEINNCVDTLKRELNIITESQEHRGLLLDAVEIIQQLQAIKQKDLQKYIELQEDYLGFVKKQNKLLQNLANLDYTVQST